MTARAFVDTDVLVYAHDSTAGEKRDVARHLVEGLWQAGLGCVSVQVLQELYVALSRKVESVSPEIVRALVDSCRRWPIHSPDGTDVLAAIDLHQAQRPPHVAGSGSTRLGCPKTHSPTCTLASSEEVAMTPAQRGTYRRTRRAARLLSVAVAGLLLLTSCGLGKKQQVGNFDYSGTWRGTVTDEANGAGSLLVTLQQAEYALAGTWLAVVGGDAARQEGGTWTGQLFVGKESDLLDVTLTPAVAGGCSYRLTLARSQESMSGSYEPVGASPACGNLTRGTVSLTKQK